MLLYLPHFAIGQSAAAGKVPLKLQACEPQRTITNGCSMRALCPSLPLSHRSSRRLAVPARGPLSGFASLPACLKNRPAHPAPRTAPGECSERRTPPGCARMGSARTTLRRASRSPGRSSGWRCPGPPSGWARPVAAAPGRWGRAGGRRRWPLSPTSAGQSPEEQSGNGLERSANAKHVANKPPIKGVSHLTSFSILTKLREGGGQTTKCFEKVKGCGMRRQGVEQKDLPT